MLFNLWIHFNSHPLTSSLSFLFYWGPVTQWTHGVPHKTQFPLEKINLLCLSNTCFTYQICIRTLIPSTSMVFILKSTPRNKKNYITQYILMVWIGFAVYRITKERDKYIFCIYPFVCNTFSVCFHPSPQYPCTLFIHSTLTPHSDVHVICHHHVASNLWWPYGLRTSKTSHHWQSCFDLANRKPLLTLLGKSG